VLKAKYGVSHGLSASGAFRTAVASASNESSIAVEEHLSLVRGVAENVRTVTPAFAAISAAVVYSTRGSAAYAVYREDQWQRRSKHTELES
jgi:hypothetical protein